VTQETSKRIEESMRWCQKSFNMLFMSGMNVSKFKDIGNDMVLKFDNAQKSVQFTKSKPIDATHIYLDPD